MNLTTTAPQRMNADELAAILDDSYGGPLATITGVATEYHVYPHKDRRSVIILRMAFGPVRRAPRPVWVITADTYAEAWLQAIVSVASITSAEIAAEDGDAEAYQALYGAES